MILRIFVLSGASIGVIGTVAGFVLGLVFTDNIEAIRQVTPKNHRHRSVCRRDLFLHPHSGAHRHRRGRRRRDHGARPLFPRHALPVLARRPARPGRSSALRVIPNAGRRGARIAGCAPRLPAGRNRAQGAERRRSRLAAGRDRRAGRPVGRRQIDIAACRGIARAARWRRRADRRRGLRQSVGRAAHIVAALGDRLRLPIPSPAAGILGTRKRHAAADDRRRRAPPGARQSGGAARPRRARRRAPGTARRGCRAASSSASRSSARSPTTPASCWPTSRPAISTTRPATA